MSNGKTKKAIICPNCGKLISANAEECYFCGLKHPGKTNLFSFVQKLFRGKIGIVTTIIYFCVGLYVVSLLLEPKAILQNFGSLFNIFSPSSRSLVILGMTGYPSMNGGQWWTLLTAIYLHGGLLHILFNMLWIRQLGPMVDSIFGTSRFVLIFSLSGIFGFVLSNALSGAPTIGASGSIFGLLGALIYYGRSRGGAFGQIIYPQLMTWAVVMFLFGFFSPGINNYAHLGGFIGGYLTGNVLGYHESKAETALHRKLAAMLVIATVVAFLLVLLTMKTSLRLYGF